MIVAARKSFWNQKQTTRFVIQTTSSNKTFKIYSTVSKDSNIPTTVKWGDGTSNTVSGNISQLSHTYSSTGTFIIRIDDTISSIAVASNASTQNWRSLLKKVYLSKSITTIPNNAFSGCSNLVFVSIPDTIKTISSGAFFQCSNLTSVELPKTITSIGNSSFSYAGLTSIVIPDSVTSIGSYAFQYCSNITDITIGKGVTSIGEGAFISCASIVSFTVNPENTAFCSVNGLLLSKDEKTLLFGINNNVVIPNTVTTIQDTAFYEYKNLTSITIPDSVLSIGEHAFYYCERLTGHLAIPDSVTAVGRYAFYKCGITSLVIGSGLNNIGVLAFVMNNCASVSISQSNSTYDSRNNCNAIIKTSNNQLLQGCKTTQIPNTVTSIGGYSFYNIITLTSIVIPNSVASIGDAAFEYCRGLTGSLTIPDSVTSIGKQAFWGCSGLTSVTIGNSVKSIGDQAFLECTGLTGSLIIPNSVTSIGNQAFSGCSSITNLSLGNSVKTIGTNAFNHCAGLTSVTIPNSVTSLGGYVFSNCSSLATITIGTGITSIAEYAFSSCIAMSTIEFSTTTAPTLGTNVFGGLQNTYTGRNSYSSGINKLKVPTGATGYDTGQWLDPLCSSTKCGFTLEYI